MPQISQFENIIEGGWRLTSRKSICRHVSVKWSDFDEILHAVTETGTITKNITKIRHFEIRYDGTTAVTRVTSTVSMAEGRYIMTVTPQLN